MENGRCATFCSEYHGDALGAGAGLVYREYGLDIVDRLRRRAFGMYN